MRKILEEVHPKGKDVEVRDRGGGGAGRAIALPLFCWDLFSSAAVNGDMEKFL